MKTPKLTAKAEELLAKLDARAKKADKPQPAKAAEPLADTIVGMGENPLDTLGR